MDVFDIYAKLSLNSEGYDEGLDKAHEKAENFGSQLLGTLGNIGTAIGTATVAIVTTATAAVTSIVGQAVESYADYEQLIGGVETLFKDSADIVKDYAVEAYKTAGISANDYMEQATSFSARLIQSLDGDTAKAAELTNQAIIDMADNANKMGSDIQSIQNAYQGFAKANYTMLDNLKLGYGGTKEEMERLLADAEELTGVHYDIEQFDDIIEAIHAVQTELGITGTTAQEASSTISGSLSMLKASWADMLTSIAGGGVGMSEAIANLVESAETFIGNVIPVIEEALYGLGDLIQGIAPIIAERLPELVETLVPMLLDTAMYLVTSLVDALPELIGTIAEALIDILPQLVETAIELLDTLLTTIIPLVLEVGMALILTLGQGIADNIENIMDSIINLMQFVVNIFLENLPMILDVALQIILALAEGLLMNINPLTDMIVQLIGGIVQTIVENIPLLLEMGLKIGLALVEGILLAIPSLLVSIGRFFGIIDEAKDKVTNDGKQMKSNMDTTFDGIVNSANSAVNKVESANRDMSVATKETSDMTRDYSLDVITNTQQASHMATDALTKIHVAFEGMIDYSRQFAEAVSNNIDKVLNKLNELATLEIRPVLDASGIIDACSAIDSAVSRAINSLNNLGNAGGSVGGGFGGGRATGGWTEAGKTYLVGEQGPELLTMTRDMYVHNADETASILGASKVESKSDENESREAGFEQSLANFFMAYLEPMMAEISNNTRIQAEKPQVTNVSIGQKDIRDAYDRQKKADGFSFVR